MNIKIEEAIYNLYLFLYTYSVFSLSFLIFLVLLFFCLVFVNKIKRKRLIVISLLISPLLAIILTWLNYPYKDFDPQFSDSILYSGEIDSITKVKVYIVSQNQTWPTKKELLSMQPVLVLHKKEDVEELLNSLTATEKDVCKRNLSDTPKKQFASVIIFESLKRRAGYIQVFIKPKRDYISPLPTSNEIGVHGWPNCSFFAWLKNKSKNRQF